MLAKGPLKHKALGRVTKENESATNYLEGGFLKNHYILPLLRQRKHACNNDLLVSTHPEAERTVA